MTSAFPTRTISFEPAQNDIRSILSFLNTLWEEKRYQTIARSPSTDFQIIKFSSWNKQSETSWQTKWQTCCDYRSLGAVLFPRSTAFRGNREQGTTATRYEKMHSTNYILRDKRQTIFLNSSYSNKLGKWRHIAPDRKRLKLFSIIFERNSLVEGMRWGTSGYDISLILIVGVWRQLRRVKSCLVDCWAKEVIIKDG